MVADTGTPVDVGRLLAERAPTIFRKLPPGAVALLRLLAHERLLNAGFAAAAGLSPLEFCDYVLRRLDVTVRVEHEEHLLAAERPVVCSNHPSGGLEGLALIATLCRGRGGCLAPANDLLRLIRPLDPIIVPVNRARPLRETAAAFERAFAADEPILVFPAGVTSRIYGGVLREYPWSSTFVTRARRHRRTILPVRASGRNSGHFYLIHRVRRVLGIGLNLEMMLLVDELLRRRGDTVTLSFSPPRSVPALSADTRDGDRRYAQALRREVEAMR